jgi:hypothetical protein
LKETVQKGREGNIIYSRIITKKWQKAAEMRGLQCKEK